MQWIATVCGRVLTRSHIQDSLESRILGNLYVRFGVGAGGEIPPAYTTPISPKAYLHRSRLKKETDARWKKSLQLASDASSASLKAAVV